MMKSPRSAFGRPQISRGRTNAALRDLETTGVVRPGHGDIEIGDRQALDLLVERDGPDRNTGRGIARAW